MEPLVMGAIRKVTVPGLLGEGSNTFEIWGGDKHKGTPCIYQTWPSRRSLVPQRILLWSRQCKGSGLQTPQQPGTGPMCQILQQDSRMLQLWTQFWTQAWMFHLAGIYIFIPRMCNLNKECKPTTGQFQDFVFCVKKKKGVSWVNNFVDKVENLTNVSWVDRKWMGWLSSSCRFLKSVSCFEIKEIRQIWVIFSKDMNRTGKDILL